MNWFKNLRISSKMICGFLTVAVIAAIVGVIGIISLSNIRNEDTKMYQEQALGLQYSGETVADFMQLRYFLLKLTTIDNSKDAQDVIKSIQQYQQETQSGLEKYKSVNAGSEDIENQLQKIQSGWSDYQKALDQTLEYLNSNLFAKADEYIITTAVPIGTTLRDDLLQLMNLVSNEAAATSKDNAVSASLAMLVLIIIVVVAVVIAILLGIYISKTISYPIRKMSALGKLLSKGNLDVESVLSGKDHQIKDQKDEIGELALAFHELITTTTRQVNALQKLSEGDLTLEFTAASEQDRLGQSIITLSESLNGLIGSIMTAADQVTSGSSMVSHSSMSLSEGATEQASSVEELTASLEEIASQTNLNAQNATKANELAHEARQNAATGNDQMREMLKAMEEISTSSANINKIIKVIDDIAFQTNILALNAAVEAARAGQHGKGFAVVAEEVRTLAARSASAASETTELIENSIRKVEAGTKIANETAAALRQIVNQVDTAADLVHAIAEASSEQAIGVEQINQGIVQVSQVVQTNAATAEESAAASEELTAQAEQLKETVGVFKIKKRVLTSVSHAGSEPAEKPARRFAGVKPSLLLEDQDMGKY